MRADYKPNPNRANRNWHQKEYLADMKAVSKRVEEREKVVEQRIDPGFVEGNLVLCAGQIYRAGEVDPMGKWVMLGVHKHGTDMCGPVSDDFYLTYKNECLRLNQDSI